MNLTGIGKKIREARIQRGMTQQLLAEKAEVSISSIAKIERNEREPSLTTFVKIVQALEVSSDDLLENVKIPTGCERYAEYIQAIERMTGERKSFTIKLLDALIGDAE